MNKILSAVFIIFIISCNKNNDVESFVIEKEEISFVALQSEGKNSGATSYIQDLRVSKNSKTNSSDLFLSQFPLVEYRYVVASDYDSIISYEISKTSLDTINISVEVVEINRDTLSFEKGPLWLRFNERSFHSLYIGLPGVEIDTTFTFDIKVDVTNLELNNNEFFSTAIYYKFNNDGTSQDGIASIPLYTLGYQSINKDYYIISDSVPVYDDFGNILEYSNGIEVPQMLFRGFDNGLEAMNADYTISIRLKNGDEIIQNFQAKFVHDQEYSDRICWLSGNINCSELFEH